MSDAALAADPAARDHGPGTLNTLARGLEIVEMLAADETITVRDVASALDTSRSSAYRIIRTLHDRGWLREIEPGVYGPGTAPLEIFSRIRGRSAVRAVALPWLERLRTQTGETITLSIRVDDDWRVPIEQLESENTIRMSVELGQRSPLYAGASGRALLMGLSPDEFNSYLGRVRLEPLTPSTIANREALIAAVDDARQRGFAVSAGERDAEAFSIAAPLYEYGVLVGSLAICGPISRFREHSAETWGAHLLIAVKSINQALSRHPDQGD